MTITSADNDAWTSAEGQRNGKPSLVRFRPNLEIHLGSPLYPRLLTITWEYEEHNQSGLPTDEQSDEMRTFEDALVDALDPELLAILALVLTNSGSRQWQFYTNDISVVGARINQALCNLPKMPITLQVDEDPEWSELKFFIDACA